MVNFWQLARHRWSGLRLSIVSASTLLILLLGAPSATASSSIPDSHGSTPASIQLIAAPKGSGSTCSQLAPCSLRGAQKVARTIEPNMKSNVVVSLEDGQYDLSHQKMTFGPHDSGTNGFQVTYAALPGTHPVLSGGKSISGWHLVAGTSQTWAAPVAAGFDTRQLYLNGKSMPLSHGLPSAGFVQTSTGYTMSAPSMANWPDASSISAVFAHGNGAWAETSCPIASIVGANITMIQPCWGNLHLPPGLGIQESAWVYGPQGGFGGLSPLTPPSYFENAYELLTPGHWSIDLNSHQIYYMAMPGQDMVAAHAIVPVQPTLVDVEGTLDAPVHDLRFQGLQFAYGTWTAPDSNDGFAQMQANWRLTGPNAATTQGTCSYSINPGTCPYASWTRTPANVVLSATHNVTMVGNTFAHLGGAGLDIMYGSQHDLITGNEFTDISASGIQLGGTNDPNPADVGANDREINSNNTITDNYIHNVANQYLGGIGIWVGYTNHTLITHNQINNVPYTAISIGWAGWHTTFINPDSDPNVNSYNQISDNLLFNYMQTLGDGGAIYVMGRQGKGWPDQLVLSGNVAYAGTNNDFNLYTDAGSQYITLNDNVVYDQPVDSFATGGCQTVGHIRITGNYFSQIAPLYPCDLVVDVVASGNHLVCTNMAPSEAPIPLLFKAGIEPSARAVLQHELPTVNLVGPTALPLAGGQVLVSGSGFDAKTKVYFGAGSPVPVKVLSGNYLIVTAPSGVGTVDLTVTTGAGTSATSPADQITYQATPAPCLPIVGGSFSSAMMPS